MNTPRCAINLKGGGAWYALEDYTDIRKRFYTQEYIEFTAHTYEEHEYLVTVRVSEVVAIVETTPERYIHEAQAFFEAKAQQAGTEEMHRRFTDMAASIARDIGDES